MPRKTMVFKANAGKNYANAVQDFYRHELQNKGASKNPFDIHMSFGASTGGVKTTEAVSFSTYNPEFISGSSKTNTKPLIDTNRS